MNKKELLYLMEHSTRKTLTSEYVCMVRDADVGISNQKIKNVIEEGEHQLQRFARLHV